MDSNIYILILYRPTDKLNEDVIAVFKSLGSSATTIEEAKNDKAITNYIQ